MAKLPSKSQKPSDKMTPDQKKKMDDAHIQNMSKKANCPNSKKGM